MLLFIEQLLKVKTIQSWCIIEKWHQQIVTVVFFFILFLTPVSIHVILEVFFFSGASLLLELGANSILTSECSVYYDNVVSWGKSLYR